MIKTNKMSLPQPPVYYEPPLSLPLYRTAPDLYDPCIEKIFHRLQDQ